MRLVPFRDKDADTVISWIKDERAFRLWSADTYKKYPATASDINARYKEITENHKGKVYPFMAVEEDTPVGHLIMRIIEEDPCTVRFGYIIVDSEIRGMGYGKRMLRLALDYAKNTLGAEKITLGVFEQNSSAYHCYKSVGFAECGETECHILDENWRCIEMENSDCI